MWVFCFISCFFFVCFFLRKGLKSPERRVSHCYYLTHSCFYPANAECNLHLSHDKGDSSHLMIASCHWWKRLFDCNTSVGCAAAPHVRHLIVPVVETLTLPFWVCQPAIRRQCHFYTLFHLVVVPHDQHKQERLSKTDNCIYYYLKLFTSVGLQNQSQHFSLSRVESSTGATLSSLYSAHRPVWLQQPDLRVWLLNIVQVPPVSGQCALWVCAQCRQWFRCKSPK